MNSFLLLLYCGKKKQIIRRCIRQKNSINCMLEMKPTLRKTIFIISTLLIPIVTFAKNIEVGVSPANWWIGMKKNTITLVASGNFNGPVIATLNYPGIKIDNVYPGEKGSYLFIEITIQNNASAGVIPIYFKDAAGNNGTFNFTLNKRSGKSHQTITQKDIIYQIVPDRFCNGDSKNDKINGYYEVNDRMNPIGIHGGDLQGIINSLPYISALGFTCLDILPLSESNLMSMSYQRNGSTNEYEIDKRLGDLTTYKKLISESKKHGLKIIHTIVLHQLGKYHPWVQTPPFKSFFYQSDLKYQKNEQLISTDPYASEYDKQKAYGVWTELNMPSLNQKDTRLQNLLIQNCLWWIEESNADAIKIEDIDRNSPEFLQALLTAIQHDFPELDIISDSSPTSHNNDFWQNITKQANIKDDQIHISDYPLASSLADAFSVYREHNEGLIDLYKTVTHDYKYLNPYGNIIMADNHQLSRLYSNADKEINQSKIMLGFILTTRGIPSILYGTEWLLDGTINKGKGFIRKDFPGGWTDDKLNGFSQNGFSQDKKDFYDFAHRIINWRNKNSSLFTGRFVQFAPQDGIYAYYRQKNEDAAFILINNTDTPIRIGKNIYKEILGQYKWGFDIVSESRFDDFTNILISAKSILILHLKN